VKPFFSEKLQQNIVAIFLENNNSFFDNSDTLTNQNELLHVGLSRTDIFLP